MRERRFGFSSQTDLHLREWMLANGLRVATLVDRAAPVVTYQTWIAVGSGDEEAGKTGLAHFFEHLMFAGTERFPAGTFDVQMEGVGAETNAATWTDWTSYYESLPAHELELAIELEADRYVGFRVEQTKLDSEREVVLSERRDRVDDDIEGLAGETLWQMSFASGPYRHPTLGFEADIRAYNLADLKLFHERWYTPQHTVIVVAGDFDEQAVIGAIANHYGSVPKGKRRPKPIADSYRRSYRERELRSPAASEKLLCGYPAPAYSSPDYAPLAVLSEILFGGRSSRAQRELVFEKELASDVYGSVTPFRRPSLFEVGLSARPGEKVQRAAKRLDALLHQTTQKAVTKLELERAIARLELHTLTSIESAQGKADTIGFHLMVTGDAGGALDRLTQYRDVSTAAVLGVAQKYLGGKRSMVKVVPE